MKQQDRIEFIDVYRGIGIILMIMGHIGFGHHFDFFIHSFHMPMFFFISGFLFKQRQLTTAQFTLKKVRTLLIPYFAFGLFHLFMQWALGVGKDGPSLLPLYHLLWVNTNGLPIAGALWFLTSLFFTDILYFILDKNIKSQKTLSLIIVILAILGNLETVILPVRLPFAIGPALVGLGLFHIARLIHDSFRKHPKGIAGHMLNLNFMEWLIGTALVTGLIFVNGYINMREGAYSILPLFWVNAVAFSILLLNFSKWLCAIGTKNKLINACLFLLKQFGKNSITSVCLNQLAILCSVFLLGHVPIIRSQILSAFLTLAATLAMLYLADIIIRKTPLRVCIGSKIK